ncbi:4-oxalomesaconate tautomerase [Ruegeria lacuscaerulensis]|uniref:4-oxalomesaconate tautomerase n=1 Tax=Ruegeria lacuscaerulensis TaxID=55218 RepID=UPI001BE4B214|nr:4-oxalomesaconate tautomerase [Ruegeria lacuscaerulensis]
MSEASSSDAVRCMWMRGGTSKGGYFLADDLPSDKAERDAFLLRIMGSPDPRQIDGMGGADPLTSKVAVISKSTRPGVDVNYLFLQVFVDQAIVTDAQNCGNILAGVGPFAIERGLVQPKDEVTPVTVFMENTGQISTLQVQTRKGRVVYAGDARIDGVPGSAAPIPISFTDTAGSTCGSLLPTGQPVNEIDGVQATLIDNGMPVVVVRARDVGIEGTETRDELDGNEALKARLEGIRLKAGHLMNLGDVSSKSVPKMTMISSAKAGGAISTRTFIPHRCHASIGVLGAVSVATACLLDGAPAAAEANVPQGSSLSLSVEHPSGETTVVVELSENGEIETAGILRTARKLFDGTIFAD